MASLTERTWVWVNSGDGEGQESLEGCSPWGHKKLEWSSRSDQIRSVAQSCPTLCDPMDCSPPGSVHGDSPGKNAEIGCHILLQGIFPTQGSKPGLPHCRWILYHLNHQGSSLEQLYFHNNLHGLDTEISKAQKSKDISSLLKQRKQACPNNSI